MCEALTCVFTKCERQTLGKSQLCHMHQDFYNPETWMKDWLTHPRRDNVVLLGYQKGSVMRNLEDHIRYATKEKVRIPEGFVRSLPALPKYTDLYLLLCENEYVDPLWNAKLLNLCFAEFLKRRKVIFTGFWPNIHTSFRSLLENPSMGPTIFFFKFLSIAIRLKKQSTINAYYHDIDYKAIVDEFFSPEDDTDISDIFKNCCLASKEHLVFVAKCNDEVSKEFFTTVVYPHFQAKKAEVRRELKEDFDEFKREIVEIVYHPRNVERWLETGGWDLWEMMC
jgi:hypothetical protein